jgi:hypothetical protein
MALHRMNSVTIDVPDVDDQLWKPEVSEGTRSLYSWGPPPRASFLRPDDLAELMAGSHPVRA